MTRRSRGAFDADLGTSIAARHHDTRDPVRHLKDALSALRRVGMMRPVALLTPDHLFSILLRVAEVNLPLARIVEGHANVLRLIAVHGTAAQRTEIWAQAETGAVFGVWGCR